MDPDARVLIISQLIVIIVPITTLIGVWIWLLDQAQKDDNIRTPQIKSRIQKPNQ